MRIVIFITAANKKEAEKIASSLVSKRLVACANIVDKIKSIFWWEGKIDHSKETLLILKSKKEKLTQIIKVVISLHSYKVPEIIALPIIAGYKPYLDWVDESIR